jgi:hypothetical protein
LFSDRIFHYATRPCDLRRSGACWKNVVNFAAIAGRLQMFTPESRTLFVTEQNRLKNAKMIIA